uniref:Ceramide synthase 1 n=1 Tax=Ciona intestinalis TaxID=7719 RepID=F6TI40_CIOIN|nr:ceramide synthase 1 [Ciona intestinalis]|eukprot:XP_002127723.1 ceramide synthase 1 [Ciona intestinalis]
MALERVNYNFTYPSYSQFFNDVLGTMSETWRDLEPMQKTPKGWMSTVKRYGVVAWKDLYYAVFLALLWTALRSVVTLYILKPIAIASSLGKKETRKAPESAWKLLFYSCTWSYSIYILFFTTHNYFYDAPSTFYGWRSGAEVPSEIYIAYMVQFSFYIHSVYATLFVDVWRKDSVVMLAHHFVTMLLIGFSYIFRFTNVGVLILFLHDITDILLEGTKLAVYYKTKGGWWYAVCDTISTIGFILFGVAWYVFRLYWYPLKAMYAAGYVSQMVTRDIAFYHFFNGLLWILLAMNVYWFMFIVNMAYKVLTGKANEVDDTREYEAFSDENGKTKKME